MTYEVMNDMTNNFFKIDFHVPLFLPELQNGLVKIEILLSISSNIRKLKVYLV